MIYNPEFNNTIQKTVIDKSLDIKLKNNDILIKKIIYDFLSDKCQHCNKEIINPRIINTIHVCEKCINYYIYCAQDNCCNVIYHKNIKHNDRCNSCLSWYCSSHKYNQCYCHKN